jgi:hypothetical protein
MCWRVKMKEDEGWLVGGGSHKSRAPFARQGTSPHQFLKNEIFPFYFFLFEKKQKQKRDELSNERRNKKIHFIFKPNKKIIVKDERHARTLNVVRHHSIDFGSL